MSTIQLSLIWTVQKKKSVFNKSKYFSKQNFKKWQSVSIFGHFAKATERQNDRFWEPGSDQQTRCLIRPHVKETGTSKWREHCACIQLTLNNSFHSHEYGKN